MENKEQLNKKLKSIEKWEKDQKGLFFWERIGRLPFVILDKLTPKFLQEKINILLDEIAKYVDSGGQYLVSNDTTLKKVKKELSLQDEVVFSDIEKLPIDSMEKVAESFIKYRAKNAQI